TILVRGYAGEDVSTVQIQVSDCAEIAPVALVIRGGGTVSGVARRADGAPLASAQLTLAQRSIGLVSTATDAEGRFRFDGIPSGSVQIELSHEGRRVRRIANVEDGKNVEMDIALPDEGTGQLRGRVTAGGRPLAGVRLTIMASVTMSVQYA